MNFEIDKRDENHLFITRLLEIGRQAIRDNETKEEAVESTLFSTLVMLDGYSGISSFTRYHIAPSTFNEDTEDYDIGDCLEESLHDYYFPIKEARNRLVNLDKNDRILFEFKEDFTI